MHVSVCVCGWVHVYWQCGTIYCFLSSSFSTYWLLFLFTHLSLVLHFLNNTHHPSSFSTSLSKSGISQWSPLPTSPLSTPPPFSSASPLFPPLLYSDGFFSQSSGTGATAEDIDSEAERLCWTDAGSERSLASDNRMGARERHRKRDI